MPRNQGFSARVIRYELTGIARKIKAMESSLKGAQFAVDRSLKSIIDQLECLKRDLKVRDDIREKLTILLLEKEKEEKEKEKN